MLRNHAQWGAKLQKSVQIGHREPRFAKRAGTGAAMWRPSGHILKSRWHLSSSSRPMVEALRQVVRREGDENSQFWFSYTPHGKPRLLKVQAVPNLATRDPMSRPKKIKSAKVGCEWDL